MNSFARTVRVVDSTLWDSRPFIQWMRHAMEVKNVPSVRELARRTGLSASGLASNLRGETRPEFKTVHKLARYLGANPDDLIAIVLRSEYTAAIPSSTLISGATGVVLVPVIEQRVGAGEGAVVLDYEYVSPTITGKHHVIAIRVRGDCMAPRIEEDDTVIVDLERHWQNGNVVVARLVDELVIKRIYCDGGPIRLHPDNLAYHDVITQQAEIIGVVIRVIKTV